MANYTLDEIIALRLELTQQERLALKQSLDAIDARINDTLAKNSNTQRPRETEAEILAAINQLERQHTTTAGHTNAQLAERQFMSDLKKLQEKQ